MPSNSNLQKLSAKSITKTLTKEHNTRSTTQDTQGHVQEENLLALQEPGPVDVVNSTAYNSGFV